MISSLVKSTFTSSLAIAKKAVSIVAPVTPAFVKKNVGAVVALAEKMYAKPYETTKEIVPARIFNHGEKIWLSYGVVAVSKTQAVVVSTRTWVHKKVADISALISSVELFVKSKVTQTIAFVSTTVKESHKFTVSRTQIAYNKAFSLVKSFSGKTA